ncbi:MAG: hypothetical protein AB1445_06375 [Bacillota bacterium]
MSSVDRTVGIMAGTTVVELEVSPDAVVILEGQPADYGAVLVGDSVTVIVRRGVVVEMAIAARIEVAGVIVEVLIAEDTVIVTIRDAGGNEHTGMLATATVITYGSGTLEPGELAAGDEVTVRFGADGLIYDLAGTAKFVS